jgi:hypothetical protein
LIQEVAADSGLQYAIFNTSRVFAPEVQNGRNFVRPS